MILRIDGVDSDLGGETPDSTVLSAVAADPNLGVVRENEVTCIFADPSISLELPFVLRAEADPSKLENLCPADWDVTINEVPVAPFPSGDGLLRLLPVDDSWSSVKLVHEWVNVCFCETASMTSGDNVTRIGLLSDSVVAAVTELDVIDDDYEVRLHRRISGNSDAQLVANWLTDNALLEYLEAVPQLLMVKPFLDAGTSVPGGKGCFTTYGDELSAPFGLSYQDEAAGCTTSSEWVIALDFPAGMRDDIVRDIAAGSDSAARLVASDQHR
ncbi:hypothetical protein ACWDTD_20395 [Gordonia sp. NPDC003425]